MKCNRNPRFAGPSALTSEVHFVWTLCLVWKPEITVRRQSQKAVSASSRPKSLIQRRVQKGPVSPPFRRTSPRGHVSSFMQLCSRGLHCNPARNFINPIHAESGIPDELLPLGWRERRPQHVHLACPYVFFAEMTQRLDDESYPSL